MSEKTLIIDGRTLPIDGERNVLEIATKAGIKIPSLCYHPELSIHGSCRLCWVEVDGRTVTSCTTAPKAGMNVKTSAPAVRRLRKMSMELLLANHPYFCHTCDKNMQCRLQDTAKQVGVTNVRFKKVHQNAPVDVSTHAIKYDKGKCILCGRCVRVCDEMQGVSAIEFAHRGSQTEVSTVFGRGFSESNCVGCGQCVAACPTGALMPNSEIEAVWRAIDDPTKITVATIAPSVRVGLGELFDMEPGTNVIRHTVYALRQMGFDYVYDLSTGADLTILEEATEFVERKIKGERLPQFTSCCPAWVHYVEKNYPDLIDRLSTTKSPQAIFGSAMRKVLPGLTGREKKDIVVVSFMPCIAKKNEARREEFSKDNAADVDYVASVRELGDMIKSIDLDLANLTEEQLSSAKFDGPFTDFTGGGVIFGATGGVAEAALRYAADKLGDKKHPVEFEELRGAEGVRRVNVKLGDTELKLVVIHTLGNAKALLDEVRAGTADFDLMEVMSCPMGCVGGGGQPQVDTMAERCKRAQGLYNDDKIQPLRKSQENESLNTMYKNDIKSAPGGHEAHETFHTGYHKR